MNKNCFFSLLLLLTSFAACKKDSEPALSGDKSVLQVTASNPGASSMPVTIDNAKHRVIISAICPTNQGEITLSVTAAEKATCSLAPGTVLDLHGTKKFSITAEDGSKQDYAVFVQGCSIYSSHFFRNCGVERQVDCVVQDNQAAEVDGSSINLSFKELPDANLTLENDYRVALLLKDSNWKTGIPATYQVSPTDNQESKASFSYASWTSGYLASPSGTVSITNIDTENRLVSGSFSFGQFSDVTCGSGSSTDYIAGEFYSVPY